VCFWGERDACLRLGALGTHAHDAAMQPDEALISTEVRGPVFLVGFDRPKKKNAFNTTMLRQLAEAWTHYEADASLRCLVVFAHGSDFTAGLDVMEVAPHFAAGEPLFPEGLVDPLGLFGPARTKPVVCAIHGRCFTIGIELALACDIRIAADGTTFAQLEVARGISPFGGATLRAPAQLGWGNAMHFMLTADSFDAAQAHRIGLVQEVVPHEALVDRAMAIAARIAAQAPLGVRETLRNARVAVEKGHDAALADMLEGARRLMTTEDAREGVASLVERRAGIFVGK
jgi:enoyl-CoA hydratase/carnithine racemase